MYSSRNDTQFCGSSFMDFTKLSGVLQKKEGTPAGPFSIKMQSVQSILTEVPLAVDVVEIELAKRSV